jgi:hypothetical protein
MTDKLKIADKAAASTGISAGTSTKATDAGAAELSVKEIEDRLAFANAARCDIAKSSAE